MRNEIIRAAAATLLLLSARFAPAAAEDVLNIGRGIRAGFEKAGGGGCFAVRDYLRELDRIAARAVLWRSGDKSDAGCIIRLVSTPLKDMIEIDGSGNETQIRIPIDFSRWRNDYTVHKYLLGVMIMIKCDIAPVSREDVDRLPAWLLAAALENFRTRSDAGTMPGRNHYELRAAEHAGFEITLDYVLEGNYMPYDGVFHDLFTQAGELLLSQSLSASSPSNNVMRELVIRSRQTGTPAECFFDTVGQALLRRIRDDGASGTPRQTLGNWFRQLIRGRSVNYFYPLPLETTTERVNALLEVTFETHDQQGEKSVKRCRLEELAGEWDSIHDKDEVIQSLRDSLLQLLNECHTEQIPALTALSGAINMLMEKREKEKTAADGRRPAPNPREIKKFIDAYSKTVLDAVGEFQRATGRQQQIENYLLEQEKILVPAEIRFFHRLRSLDNCDTVNRVIWPDVNNYLDEIGKRMHPELN